jgi:UDP-N-acetylmuramoyl-L-alanyl-D-glutamate--2,6-diaminopimelate ligase
MRHNCRMLDNILGKIRRLIPAKIFNFLNPAYHLTLAFLAALAYRFPSRQIKVIAVTGTKGKSSTVELLSAMLEEAGHRTALSDTIRFKIGDDSYDNLFKMSMPGRFFTQRLLRKAVNQGCDHAVIEMTSQGALLYRHRFIDLDALVFTNISPEHIEAHGSYEKYRDSKLEIARALGRSRKPDRAVIANADDPESPRFLDCDVERKITYSIHDVEPYQVKKEGLEFSLDGRIARSRLSGLFNLYNILAAATAAKSMGVSHNDIVRAIERSNGIPGRVERIEAGQDFAVIVDYAHTPDSLEKFYEVFKKDAVKDSTKNICVLGGTGGGRDNWKRLEMGRIADKYCENIILTDEDPYDEDPRKIVDDVAKGIKDQTSTIIMDRREAIREAIKRARPGDAVLITGKGTDPYIMGPRGTKTPWSDARIAREELEAKLRAQNPKHEILNPK